MTNFVPRFVQKAIIHQPHTSTNECLFVESHTSAFEEDEDNGWRRILQKSISDIDDQTQSLFQKQNVLAANIREIDKYITEINNKMGKIDFALETAFLDLNNKLPMNSDIDMKHFRLYNVQIPKNPTDCVTKDYVDNIFTPPQQIFTTGKQIRKKTVFFYPAYVVLYDMNLLGFNLCTSTQIAEGDNQTIQKVFLTINDSIQSDIFIEKEALMGYKTTILENPIKLSAGDRITFISETLIEPSSMTIFFK